MSAAATAAGYLYASGRLRGRAAREQEQPENRPENRENRPEKRENRPERRENRPEPREKIRVAVYEPEFESQAQSQPKSDAPRRTPKIEYRTRRRWTPE